MINHLIGFHPGLSALLLRLVLGIVFIAHGYPKLFKKEVGPKVVAGYLQTLGVPLPLFFAYVVGIVEFFGGLLVIIGLFTRLVSLMMAFDMVVAIWTVKRKTGLVSKVMEGGRVGGYELDLLLLTIAVVLAVLGSGKLSADFILLHEW